MFNYKPVKVKYGKFEHYPDPNHIHQSMFNKGYKDFFVGNVTNNFPPNSIMAKEWQRGFDVAYHVNFKKVRYNENRQRHRGLGFKKARLPLAPLAHSP